MPFEKGNKLGGRTKGSEGKTNAKLRAMFEAIVNDETYPLIDDINLIDKPEIRVKLKLEFAKFILPTLKAQEQTVIDATEKMQPITINF